MWFAKERSPKELTLEFKFKPQYMLAHARGCANIS
jgi:hypothetical protein